MIKYLAASLILIGGHALAAPPKPIAKTKQVTAGATEPAKVYSVTQLDYSTMQLPANYLGHSCRAVAKGISTLNLKKSEYETTATYEARVAGLEQATLAGGVKVGDYFAFVQDQPAALAKYDADKGTLRYTAYLLPKEILAGPRVFGVITESVETARSKYDASNAYGAGVVVTKKEISSCGLAFQNYQVSHFPGLKNISTDLVISPEEAQSSKNDLSFMYVGVLAAPYLAEYRDHGYPTIDSPIEAVWTGDMVSMKLLQIWIFNKRTGQVYKKVAE